MTSYHHHGIHHVIDTTNGRVYNTKVYGKPYLTYRDIKKKQRNPINKNQCRDVRIHQKISEKLKPKKIVLNEANAKKNF
jgi:hypothetical protein